MNGRKLKQRPETELLLTCGIAENVLPTTDGFSYQKPMAFLSALKVGIRAFVTLLTGNPYRSLPMTDQTMSGWQPIETAHTDGTRILLRGRDGKIADGHYGQPDGFANPKRFVWPYIHANPTHWAPLALIAAAQELLDAAMEVNALSIQTDAHKKLRAAIAKATGRVVADDAAPECTCAAKDMTFGRCCKLTPNKCKWCGHDIHAHDKQYGCAEDGCDCVTPNASLTGPKRPEQEHANGKK